jgi:hypothetical protein
MNSTLGHARASGWLLLGKAWPMFLEKTVLKAWAKSRVAWENQGISPPQRPGLDASLNLLPGDQR